MKSLKFEKLNLKTIDVLSREQLKNIMGGLEPTNCTSDCSSPLGACTIPTTGTQGTCNKVICVGGSVSYFYECG